MGQLQKISPEVDNQSLQTKDFETTVVFTDWSCGIGQRDNQTILLQWPKRNNSATFLKLCAIFKTHFSGATFKRC